MAYTATADGSTVNFGATSFLVDQKGHAFWFTPNGVNNSAKLYCDGTQITSASTALKKMVKYRGAIYLTDNASWWQVFTSASAPVLVLISSTAATPWTSPSLQGTTATAVAGGCIIDATNNVWAFASMPASGNAATTRNGLNWPTPASGGITLLAYAGEVYDNNLAGNWYKALLSANAWQFQAAGDPRGVVVPTNSFTEDFTTLNVGLLGGSNTWVKSRWYPPDDDLGYQVNNCWIAGSSSTFSSVASSIFNVTGGVLQLGIVATPGGLSSAVNGAGFIGGQLLARQFRQLHGYFEAKIKVPQIQGTNCAFWLMNDSDWPPEIDVAEIVKVVGGSQFPMQSVHRKKAGGAEGSDVDQVGTYIGWTNTAWHTYGCDWGPNEIRFYIDRVLTGTFPTPPEYTEPMFPIVSMQDGAADWTGGIPGGTTLGYMEVDYVYAWERGKRPF